MGYPAGRTLTQAILAATAGQWDPAYNDLGNGSGAPKLSLYAADYGVAATNTAAQNDTAIASAITAAQAAGNANIFFPRGTFQVSAPINAKASSTYGSGIGFIGQGRGATIFTNTTNTSELLQVGGYNNVFRDFTIQHSTFNSTTGDGLVFYKCAYSTFERIQIQQTGRMIAISQTAVNDPGTSTTGTANWMFSCSFDSINGNKYWKNALFLNSYVGGSTGSIWRNCYLQNISDTGTQITPTGNAIDLLNCDFVGTQVNVEDLSGAAVMLANGQCAISIAGLHMERTNLPAGFNSLVRAYGGAQIALQGPSLGFSNLGLSGSGNSSIFSVGGGGQLVFDRLVLNQNSQTAGTYTIGEVTDTTAGNALEMGYYNISSSPAPAAFTNSTANTGLKRAGDLFPTTASSGGSGVAAKLASIYYNGGNQALVTYNGTGSYIAYNTLSSNDDTGTFTVALGTAGGATPANSTPGTIQPLKAGLYMVRAQVQFTVTAASQTLDIIVQLGSSTVSENAQVSGAAANSSVVMQAMKLVRVTAAQVSAAAKFSVGTYLTATASYGGAGVSNTTLEVVYLGV